MAKVRTIAANRKVEPVRIDLDGDIGDFVLQEMGGVQRDKWMSANSKTHKDGTVGLDLSGEGKIAEIISIHLHKAVLEDLETPDGEGDTVVKEILDKVPVTEVQKFSSSAQMDLLERCTTLSGLGKAATDEVKNE